VLKDETSEHRRLPESQVPALPLHQLLDADKLFCTRVIKVDILIQSAAISSR